MIGMATTAVRKRVRTFFMEAAEQTHSTGGPRSRRTTLRAKNRGASETWKSWDPTVIRRCYPIALEGKRLRFAFDGRAGPLRRAGCAAECGRGYDQEGVPQARAAVPP